MEIKTNKLFNKVTDVVFMAILIALTLAMAIGTVKLFGNIWQMLAEPGITGKYIGIITDVLTLFVLVELSKSLVDYFRSHRLRMTFIVDAAIVFFIREVMIMVFQHKISTNEIYSLSVLLLVLTVLRIGSIFMFQRERTIVETLRDE
jgi:uncharacterized membrane protein (DUF373 family)